MLQSVPRKALSERQFFHFPLQQSIRESAPGLFPCSEILFQAFPKQATKILLKLLPRLNLFPCAHPQNQQGCNRILQDLKKPSACPWGLLRKKALFLFLPLDSAVSKYSGLQGLLIPLPCLHL